MKMTYIITDKTRGEVHETESRTVARGIVAELIRDNVHFSFKAEYRKHDKDHD